MENQDYQEFRQQYELQHPASIPKMEQDIFEYPRWLQPLTLLMFIAVSIVSGAHTTSTVRQTLEFSLIADESKNVIAFFAFFGFELALFVSVFSWLRSQGRWLSYSATMVVFCVIVLANVHDVMRSLSSNDWLNGLITMGIGIGTPLVALLSGKLFVDIYRSNRGSSKRTLEGYQEALKQWDATINRAWTSYQKDIDKRQKASKTDRQQTDEYNMSVYTTDRQTDNRRVSSAIDIAYQYLIDNPDTANLTVREIGDLAGVGKDSAAKAKNMYMSNGHIQS